MIVFYEENMWQFNLDLSNIQNKPIRILTAYERFPKTAWLPHLRHIQICYHLNCLAMSFVTQVRACQPLISEIFEFLGKQLQ